MTRQEDKTNLEDRSGAANEDKIIEVGDKEDSVIGYVTQQHAAQESTVEKATAKEHDVTETTVQSKSSSNHASRGMHKLEGPTQVYL